MMRRDHSGNRTAEATDGVVGFKLL